jgi:hypothetical protein
MVSVPRRAMLRATANPTTPAPMTTQSTVSTTRLTGSQRETQAAPTASKGMQARGKHRFHCTDHPHTGHFALRTVAQGCSIRIQATYFISLSTMYMRRTPS